MPFCVCYHKTKNNCSKNGIAKLIEISTKLLVKLTFEEVRELIYCFNFVKIVSSVSFYLKALLMANDCSCF